MDRPETQAVKELHEANGQGGKRSVRLQDCTRRNRQRPSSASPMGNDKMRRKRNFTRRIPKDLNQEPRSSNPIDGARETRKRVQITWATQLADRDPLAVCFIPPHEISKQRHGII